MLGLEQPCFLSIFIGGLRHNIRPMVKMLKPKTLLQACGKVLNYRRSWWRTTENLNHSLKPTSQTQCSITLMLTIGTLHHPARVLYLTKIFSIHLNPQFLNQSNLGNLTFLLCPRTPILGCSLQPIQIQLVSITYHKVKGGHPNHVSGVGRDTSLGTLVRPKLLWLYR